MREMFAGVDDERHRSKAESWQTFERGEELQMGFSFFFFLYIIYEKEKCNKWVFLFSLRNLWDCNRRIFFFFPLRNLWGEEKKAAFEILFFFLQVNDIEERERGWKRREEQMWIEIKWGYFRHFTSNLSYMSTFLQSILKVFIYPIFGLFLSIPHIVLWRC